MSGVYPAGNGYIVKLGHNGHRLYFGSHPTKEQAIEVAKTVRTLLGPKRRKKGPAHHSYKHGKRLGEYKPRPGRSAPKKKKWPVVRAWPYAEVE
jgi:hypothetical protein